MSKVSIICITAREQPGLGRLIDSIKAQDFEGEIELVYGDRLWEKRENHVIALMEEEGVDFKYVRDMPTQPGPCPAGARNACVRECSGDYIISLDDLTFLYPDTVRRHYELFQQGFDAVCGTYFTETENGPIIEDFRITNENGVITPTDHTVWMCWWGIHTGFSKEAWERVNGYDETFDGVYGMEDIDFGHRLKMSGCAMAWESDLFVLCDKGTSHTDTHEQLIPENAPTSWSRGSLKWRNDKLIDFCRAMNIVRGKRR